jgi:hypothetical protein
VTKDSRGCAPRRSLRSTASADRNDVRTGLLVDVDTIHLERGTKTPGIAEQPVRLGLRWIVEATNTWWSTYGQLGRNTDGRIHDRHGALCLATVVLSIGKLITWRDRWSPI